MLTNSFLQQSFHPFSFYLLLFIIIIRSRISFCGSAIKVLNFCLQGSEENCRHFIDVLGLKTIFPAFMNKQTSSDLSKKKKKKAKKNQKINFDTDEDEGTTTEQLNNCLWLFLLLFLHSLSLPPSLPPSLSSFLPSFIPYPSLPFLPGPFLAIISSSVFLIFFPENVPVCRAPC